MKIYFKRKWLVLTVASVITFGACRKAESYYEKLDTQPEVRTNYQSIYGVGDTLVLEGRLNPENDLEVHIGDLKAEISSVTKIFHTGSRIKGDSLDRAKIVITTEMGIGTGRPITITSAGITIQCPAIEIIEGINNGYLPDRLQLQRHADLPAGYVPLFCQNGKGTIYYWSPGQGIIRIGKNGSRITVLPATALSDHFGNFTVTVFNSGGADPGEQYLYFSAITTDGNADNPGNQVFRFCRYDMQSKVLTTLNRSLYPTTASQRTLNVFTPFEGNIGSARLFAAEGIYPAGNGNVFIRLTLSSAVAKLDNADRLSYLFRLGATVPPVFNPETGRSYTADQIRLMLPGVNISTSFSSVRSVLPDENILYAQVGSFISNVTQIDLANAAQTYNFTPPFVGSAQEAVINGSFNILTYSASSSFGYLPLPDARLLVLYYPELNNNALFPVLTTLNFREAAARRYAPGILARNGYNITDNDRMLNYDEEGMIYMTAGNKTVIVKTTKQ